jgi:hypothetical protein
MYNREKYAFQIAIVCARRQKRARFKIRIDVEAEPRAKER